MDYLAGRMEKLVETGTRPSFWPFSCPECDYYSDKEIQKFKQTTAALPGHHQPSMKKQGADYMFEQQQWQSSSQVQ